MCRGFAMTSKTIGSTEAQNNFGRCVQEAVQDGTKFIIKRHGVAQAIILSLAEFERILSKPSDRSRTLRLIREIEPQYELGEPIAEE